LNKGREVVVESIVWYAILVVIFIVGFAVLTAVAYAIGGCLHWVLGPLQRAAKNRRFAKQFCLADLLSLFVLVQLSFGVVHWAGRDSEDFRSAMLTIDLIVAAIVVVVWWACLATLSPAGINVVWHRCVVLTVVLPTTLVGSLAIIALPFVALGALIDGRNTTGCLLLLAEPLVAGVLYGLGRFTRFIVASAEARRSELPPVPGE
jgi:hypothetical protein